MSKKQIQTSIIYRDPIGAANVGFASISRHLARKKNENFPTAPLTAEGVFAAFQMDSILKLYGVSLADGNKPFYNFTVIETAFKYTVFSSGVLLDKLATMPVVRNYHIDGTFRVVPNGEYRQLLIVHVAYQEHVSLENIRYLFLTSTFILF